MDKLKRYRSYARVLLRSATNIQKDILAVYKQVQVRLSLLTAKAKRWLSAAWHKPLTQQIRHTVTSKTAKAVYAWTCLAILLGTTLLWAWLGARLHLQNADQLVNAYLFESAATFKDAILPGSHSFLLKWPLFILIKDLDFSRQAYLSVTIAITVLTVALLAYILYRIERRPVVFGTICLALASVLLMVPTVPYAGALLPVNMAMLATRNIEYIIFVGSLILLTRSPRIRSMHFWAAVSILTLLAASDKLFLGLTLGAAALALTTYGLAKGWNLVTTSSRWILAGLISAIGATVLLWVLQIKGVVTIASQAGPGPYGLVGNVHDLLLGTVYGALHLLNNFGANPAAQTLVIRDIPHAAWQQLVGIAGLSFVINLLLLIFGIYAAYHLIRHSLAHNKDTSVWLNHPSKLSILLIWTSVASFALFIMSSHYYAGDARYLAMPLFGLFVAATTYLSQTSVRPRALLFAAPVLLLSICLGIPHALTTYQRDQEALAPLGARNDRVAAVLKQHKVNVLVGDYWRVIPIKFTRGKDTRVMPLENCTQARSILSSRSWQTDLTTQSFAYLLSLDPSITDYPRCTLDGVIAAYGRPNASVVISGSLTQPRELLLFYDNGAGHSAPIHRLPTPSTVLPIELEDIPNPICRGPILMNVVAHEDDDLLFMNPDLDTAIKSGMCVRTIYVTAGDAGSDAFYWLGREQGSQAAYSKMLDWHDIWVQRVVHLGGNRYATIANPRGNAKISLIYLHLPDGNLRGQGFSRRYESLAKLDNGAVSEIHDVYVDAAYSAEQLRRTLSDFMFLYQPTEIRTQANVVSGAFPDHSDHMAVGRFTTKAYATYKQEHFADKVTIPLNYYIGYPVHQRPANIFGPALENKEQIFQAYGAFDGNVCHSVTQCRHDSAYGAYLPRQYQSPH